MWVLLDMSTKRRGLYITYTPTRAADSSDGERTPWDAMSRRGKGAKLMPFSGAFEGLRADAYGGRGRPCRASPRIRCSEWVPTVLH